jgi:nucleoside-diphosphate-sugar epimerase
MTKPDFRRALVTGGAGFIGSHLSKAILDEGLEVVVLDNLSMGSKEKVPEGAQLIVGDVRDKKILSTALEGVDVVFHEAAKVTIRASVREFHDDAENNIMGTISLLEALDKSSVRKLIFASSMAVYADSPAPDLIDENYLAEPISPYGISKLAGEKYCLNTTANAGIDCLVLRYFNTYGPGQTFTPYVGVITIFIKMLLQSQKPVIFGDGEQERDFVYVGDIVQANLLALKSDITNQIINVGTGHATSVNEVARLLCEHISPAITPVYAEERPGELRYSIADITKARKLLGYEPAGNLQNELDSIIASVKNR